MIKLSILVCSVNNRVDSFLQNIISQINSQMADEVEILCIIDNKTMSIGEKRNRLIEMAKGEYVAFVDDDDKISDDYIDSLLEGIESNKDVICFKANISINGGEYKLVDYNIDNQNINHDNWYERMPNHLMCWKAELAKSTDYENISYGEDTKRAEVMISKVKSQYVIPKILYYYDFNEQTSESIKYSNTNTTSG